jgi:hypothetical protein
MPKPRPMLFSLIPGCRGASREQSREHRGSGPVWSRTPLALRSSATRDRIGRPGTARPMQASSGTASYLAATYGPNRGPLHHIQMP